MLVIGSITAFNPAIPLPIRFRLKFDGTFLALTLSHAQTIPCIRIHSNGYKDSFFVLSKIVLDTIPYTW